MNRSTLAVTFAMWMLSIPCVADVVVLDAANSAWYRDTGHNSLGGMNYVVGRDGFQASNVYRSFFVFDLSGISGVVTSAQLSLENSGPGEGYISPDPTETIGFFDVTTPIAQLGDRNVRSVSIYNDLGTGNSYGTIQLSSVDVNQILTITLTGAGVSSLNASAGTMWAIGAAMISQNQPAGVDEVIFGNTDETFTRQLLLTVVPEPSGLALLALGVVVLTGYCRRQFRTCS